MRLQLINGREVSNNHLHHLLVTELYLFYPCLQKRHLIWLSYLKQMHLNEQHKGLGRSQRAKCLLHLLICLKSGE